MTQNFQFFAMKGPLWLAIIFLAVGLLLAACSGFSPQVHTSKEDPKVDPVFRFKLSKEAQILADQRKSQIDMELKEIGANHPWAGRYTLSTGFESALLWLAPKSGFVYEANSDHGLWNRNWGVAKFEKGKITFKCELKNNPKTWLDSVGPPLVPVRWGDRQYLIDSTKLLDFCNAVNGGNRAWLHYFLLRSEDAGKGFSGLPDVPAMYRKYLLKEPITATVISTKPSHYEPMGGDLRLRITPAIVNAGSVEGVFLGMEFHTVGQLDPLSIVVEDVARHSCRVEFKDLGDKNPLPSKSWRLSSRCSHP